MEAFPGGAIAPGGATLDPIHQGVLTLNMDNGAFWTDKWPYAYLFTSIVNGMSAMETLVWYEHGGGLELAKEMFALRNMNIELFNGFPFPPEIFLSSTVPLQTEDDIAGLRIRTPGAGIDGIAFSRMGASVVNIPGSELYESVQRGVVDAFQFSTPATDYSVSLYEVVDYVYMSPVRQSTDWQIYTVNRDAYNELPDDLKRMVKELLLVEGMRFFMELVEEDADAVEFYKDYGVTVEPASKVLEDALAEVADEVYEELAATEPMAKKILDSYFRYQERLEDYPPL
jgi:TRAP-type mannitol/chloroaromatic compound transport system substrate-binding protein